MEMKADFTHFFSSRSERNHLRLFLLPFHTKLCVRVLAVSDDGCLTHTQIQHQQQSAKTRDVRSVRRANKAKDEERERKTKNIREKPPFLLLVYRDGTFLGGRFVPRDPRSPDTEQYAMVLRQPATFRRRNLAKISRLLPLLVNFSRRKLLCFCLALCFAHTPRPI